MKGETGEGVAEENRKQWKCNAEEKIRANGYYFRDKRKKEIEDGRQTREREEDANDAWVDEAVDILKTLRKGL